MYVCVPRACLVPTDDRRGIGSPGTRITDGCEVACRRTLLMLLNPSYVYTKVKARYLKYTC